ncbi:uncharacterized protein LOC111326347 [Stylophora pistillata]|uniref:uncharacterized protein LOC111326347 n=1 Tax=Stylophora pistillata TaxID=50429 RepID=UPI000C04CA51|nr:uncharacterized protein LOC111326347 [Stylophora pistillata]
MDEVLSNILSNFSSIFKEGENSIPPGSPSLRKLTVTFLASEWRSSRDGLSDIKRELAENMAKDPKVQVIFFVPKCDDEDKEEAKIQGVQLVEAGNNPVCDGLTCLNFLPVNSPIDVVVGHGIELAGPAQFIKWLHKCKWVQIVHEAHEEIGVFKECSNPITNAQKKHELEVKLCKESDFVVTIGPKLTETFRRSCEKDECFFEFTPGILAEFSGLKQDLKERKIFRVLCFVCGDPEDFKLKGLDIVAGAVAKLNDCHLVFVSLVDDKLKFKLEDTKQRLLECGLPHYQLRLRGLLDCRRSLEKELLEADLAVMPSRVEGFGVIGLQALSAGLPILVGRNSGLGEALMKVKFGSFFVVDSEDPEVWAKAIKNACHKDRTMRLQECEMLRELYKEVYSWEEQIESLINKFNKLIINSPSEVSGCSPSEHHTLIISVGPKQRKRKRKRQRKGSQAKMDLKRAKGKQKGEAQKEEELRQNLMREMAKRFIDECNDEIASEPFFQGLKYYLERELNLRIEQAVEGSLRIKVECRTLEILERLWEDYTSGHLNAEAEKRLLTDEIKRTYDVETIKLETIILREDYFACKLSFAGNIKVSFTDAKKSRIPLTGEMVPTSNDIKNGIHASDKDLTLFSDEKVTAVVTADTKSETTERTQKFPLVLTKGQIEETVSASPMPSPRDIDARRKIFDDTVGVISTETALLREQPSFCETSASVKSPVDDLALIGELRNRTVTQRIATRCQAHIGNCWRTLGVFFEIDESVLNNIETDFPTAEEKGFKVLEIWRDKEGRSATVRCLEDALLEIGKRRIAENILDIVREERGRESKQKGDRSKEDEPNRVARLENVRKKNQPKLKTRGGFRKLENESERVKRLENVRRDNVENRKPAAGEPSKTPLKKKRSKSSGATKKKADIVKEADINY